jgi:hypothetical protein
MLSLILKSAVPSKHVEHTHQGVTGTDAYHEHTGQELMRSPSIHIRN